MASDEINNKKVDGIKKLSPEEQKLSRQIVLDSIGEGKKKISSPPPAGKKTPVLKVDSLIKKRKERKEVKEDKKLLKSDILGKYKEDEKEIIEKPKPALKVSEEKKAEARNELNKLLPADGMKEKEIEETKPEPIEKETSQAARKPTPEKPKQAAPAPRKTAMEISRINPFTNDVVKERIAEKKKQAEEAARKKKKLEEEKARAEAAKKEARRKRLIRLKMLQERRQKEKQKAKEISRVHRAKRRKELRKKIKLSIDSVRPNLKYLFKKAVLYFLVMLMLMFLIYSCLTVIILKFSPDHKIARYILGYIPVPAYITETGIIEYYYYIDMKNELNRQSAGEDNVDGDVKIAIAKKIIIDDLIKKYSLEGVLTGETSEEQKNIITGFLTKDPEINQVGLNRIMKIKEFIDKGGDFVKVANKYGDEQDLVNINPGNFDQYSYSQEVSKLAVGQISDIITDEKGYYIFRCYDKTDDRVALSYVFVKAKTLPEYISEKTSGYRMWSLVD